MNAADLQRYLHDHIPLSLAMQVRVAQASPEQVMLTAPLAPNINHRETVFGGSASALCILAAWSLLNVRLRSIGVTAKLVIQRNVMDYVLPIAGTFDARASIIDEPAWQRFARTLHRKGRARIDVVAALEYEGRIAGRLAGTFVAFDRPIPDGAGIA